MPHLRVVFVIPSMCRSLGGGISKCSDVNVRNDFKKRRLYFPHCVIMTHFWLHLIFSSKLLPFLAQTPKAKCAFVVISRKTSEFMPDIFGADPQLILQLKCCLA